MKLLLADDDDLSLQILVNYLTDAGYELETAMNGREALEKLQKNPSSFSAIIVDRIMPHMHAIDLLKIMQADPKLKDIPVIILTGEVSKEEIIEALKAGVFDLLYKPIEKGLLLSVIKKALGERGGIPD